MPDSIPSTSPHKIPSQLGTLETAGANAEPAVAMAVSRPQSAPGTTADPISTSDLFRAAQIEKCRTSRRLSFWLLGVLFVALGALVALIFASDRVVPVHDETRCFAIPRTHSNAVDVVINADLDVSIVASNGVSFQPSLFRMSATTEAGAFTNSSAFMMTQVKRDPSSSMGVAFCLCLVGVIISLVWGLVTLQREEQ